MISSQKIFELTIEMDRMDSLEQIAASKDKHWDYYVNYIKENEKFFRSIKRDMIKAVSTFREVLGKNWLKTASKNNHPLYWELDGIQAAANHSMILKWGLAIQGLQKTQGFQVLLKRIKSKDQFYSVMHELELAHRLTTNGANVVFNPNFNGKHPDILCNFDGGQLFFEVKGIGRANRTNRANITMAKLSSHANMPIMPCGKVFRILDGKELEECAEIVEQKCQEAIEKNKGVECFIPNKLKFYFVAEGVKNRVQLYKEWCGKQKFFEGIYRGGLLYPDDKVQPERRVRQRLHQITKDNQLPTGGLVFLASTDFYLYDHDNTVKVANKIRSYMKKIPNISAVILYSWIFGFNSEKNTVIKDDGYVLRTTYSYDDLREDILIIKNNFAEKEIDIETLDRLLK